MLSLLTFNMYLQAEGTLVGELFSRFELKKKPFEVVLHVGLSLLQSEYLLGYSISPSRQKHVESQQKIITATSQEIALMLFF